MKLRTKILMAIILSLSSTFLTYFIKNNYYYFGLPFPFIQTVKEMFIYKRILLLNPIISNTQCSFNGLIFTVDIFAFYFLIVFIEKLTLRIQNRAAK